MPIHTERTCRACGAARAVPFVHVLQAVPGSPGRSELGFRCGRCSHVWHVTEEREGHADPPHATAVIEAAPASAPTVGIRPDSNSLEAPGANPGTHWRGLPSLVFRGLALGLGIILLFGAGRAVGGSGDPTVIPGWIATGAVCLWLTFRERRRTDYRA